MDPKKHKRFIFFVVLACIFLAFTYVFGRQAYLFGFRRGYYERTNSKCPQEASGQTDNKTSSSTEKQNNQSSSNSNYCKSKLVSSKIKVYAKENATIPLSWKKFVDEKCLLSFYYPSDWEVNFWRGEGIGFYGRKKFFKTELRKEDNKYQTTLPPGSPVASEFTIKIEIEKENPYLNIFELACGAKESKPPTIKINNIVSINEEAGIYIEEDTAPGKCRAFLVPLGSMIYKLSYCAIAEEEHFYEYFDTFEKIVSTFQTNCGQE